MFEKVTLIEILECPLLIGFAGLQYKICNAARNLAKFLKGVLRLTEYFQEVEGGPRLQQNTVVYNGPT